MTYTIKQAAEKTGFSAYTLRFYGKEGLLPFLKKDKIGNRVFTDNDLLWLQFVRCLKETDMPISNIKAYIDMCLEGNSTIIARKIFLEAHKKRIESRLAEMQTCLEKINFKIEHYEKCSIDLKLE